MSGRCTQAIHRVYAATILAGIVLGAGGFGSLSARYYRCYRLDRGKADVYIQIVNQLFGLACMAVLGAAIGIRSALCRA